MNEYKILLGVRYNENNISLLSRTPLKCINTNYKVKSEKVHLE